MCSLTTERVLLPQSAPKTFATRRSIQNVFPYYRTCSLTTERAQDFCDQALKFDPFHIPTCLIYGQLLLETKGDLDSAERMYPKKKSRTPARLDWVRSVDAGQGADGGMSVMMMM